MDAPDAADQAHAKFRDEQSDFLSYLHLWRAFHHQMKHLSGSKLRKWCKENYLSFVRMREWHDIHTQLREVVTNPKKLRQQHKARPFRAGGRARTGPRP
jgi:ATP-dependent helicase HrpA